VCNCVGGGCVTFTDACRRIAVAAAAETVAFVRKVMQDNFPRGPDSVPFHSRWRHFESGGIDRLSTLLASWADVDKLERARRMIDLAVVRHDTVVDDCRRWGSAAAVVGVCPCASLCSMPRRVVATQVSVLLDAGAGNSWKFQEASSGQSFSRSEGLGVS
jgi:hypothetical protein